MPQFNRNFHSDIPARQRTSDSVNMQSFLSAKREKMKNSV